MNELSQLTRQHYEKNETGNSLLSKVTTILDSLPDKPLESSQLAGLDQFGDVPTKVRKTPRDLAQTRIYTRTRGFLRLPKSAAFRPLILEA